MRRRSVRIGDWVRFARLPDWLKELPEEIQQDFVSALGNAFQVIDFDRYGDLVLLIAECHEFVKDCRHVAPVGVTALTFWQPEDPELPNRRLGMEMAPRAAVLWPPAHARR